MVMARVGVWVGLDSECPIFLGMTIAKVATNRGEHEENGRRSKNMEERGLGRPVCTGHLLGSSLGCELGLEIMVESRLDHR